MTKKILCDTDFFIALLIAEDTNHEKAKKLTEKYPDHDYIYSNLTKYELMTVLSRKLNQEIAVKTFELFEDIFEEEIEFDRDLEHQIVTYYKKSQNRNQSFFDIACLIQARHFDCKIASFDQFYPSELLLN